MADDIDIANDLIANEVSRALSRIRQKGQTVEGAKFCEECGDDIPAARRKMGFNLCVPCAQEEERKGSLFAD
jgi:phage/conjugal plasmid C-4 type zinc finger TraR family protein